MNSIKIPMAMFLLLFVVEEGQSGEIFHSVLEYGAVGDGATVNTEALQEAINEISAQGGGTVFFPAGIFLSGTLHLRSNITLYLEMGAVLKGSFNMADYPDGLGLLYGEDLINISIKGEGEINGNGSSFMEWGRLHAFVDFKKSNLRQGEDFLKGLSGAGEGPVAYAKRPNMMIILMHCENVTIEGIRLTDSPNWTARIGNCENVVVRGVSILNNQMIPNSDGFHFTTSRSVRVSNCTIVAGDDALIVTGFGVEIDVNGRRTNKVKDNYRYGNKTGIAEDIVVSNCILSSRSAGIRIGYGDNDMQNCLFQNIIIRNSNRGVGLFTRDKGSIENVTFSNFTIDTRLYEGTWWGRGEPIHVSAVSQQEGQEAGSISNISFKSFTIRSETGIVIYGERPGAINDLEFEDLKLLIVKGEHWEDGGNIDLRPTASFETNLFKRDLPAILFRNVDNLTFQEVEVKWGEDVPAYFTHALEGENFSNVQISGFTGRHAGSTGAAIFLKDGDQVYLRNSVAADGTDTFLKVENVQNRKIFEDNDLKAARVPVFPLKSAKE